LSLLGNNKSLLLVYRNMGKPTLVDPVNIMFPPQFYTLKKETVPVRYAFQAKKIAPSLFEGLLESTETYEYMVFKEEDQWVFIAYSMHELSSFLESKGISASQVGKIFFAQQALDSFKEPVFLGEKDALLNIDGIVANVPQTVLPSDTKVTRVEEVASPKSGLALQGSQHSVISQKQAIGLSTLFMFFAILFFIEGWQYGSSSQKLQQEIDALLEEYPALQSQYKRKSIAEKYRAIDKNERQKRDTIKTLGGMIFKGVKVETFSMNNKTFTVRFVCLDAKVARRLKDLAKKEGFTSVKTLTGNIVSIEGTL